MSQMKQFTLKGKGVVKGRAEGEAVVTREHVTFVGGVDPMTGIVTEEGHELKGVCLAGKILVYPTGKGSTGSSYQIYDMAVRGMAPKAFVNIKAEPIAIIGAIMGEIPAVDSLDQDPTQCIATGDYLEVNAYEGIVVVRPRTTE